MANIRLQMGFSGIQGPCWDMASYQERTWWRGKAGLELKIPGRVVQEL
jgi:hypothetical protein